MEATMFNGLIRAACLFVAIFISPPWPASQAAQLELSDVVAAVPNPRAADRGWVADPAGAIELGRDELDALIRSFEGERGVEITVVLLPSIGELVPKSFATALFNHWGVGKKGRDNGVLVLHVLDQRRIEIETGYGLEGALPDVKCHWIIEDIAIPFFKVGSFSDGHYEIVRALIAGIRNPDVERRQLTGNVERVPGARVDPSPTGYTAIPPLILQVGKAVDSLLVIVPIIAFCAGLAMLLLWPLLSWRFRLAHSDPSDQLAYFRKRSWLLVAGAAAIVLAMAAWEWRAVGSIWSFLLAFPGGLLAHRYRERRLTQLRYLPRLDPKTGEPMRRLGELEDDAYLAAGQIWEEKLGSIDYDVWLSPSGYYRVEPYRRGQVATVCEKCGYRTFRKTGSRIISPATHNSEGVAEDTYTCANCGYLEEQSRVLAAIGASSYSGGGGDSGGGSSGGSSGGGGAGGSY